MNRKYHVVDINAKEAEASLGEFCRANGQALLPLVELIQEARVAVDTVIDQLGRKTVETILVLSAEEVALDVLELGDAHLGIGVVAPGVVDLALHSEQLADRIRVQLR